MNRPILGITSIEIKSNLVSVLYPMFIGNYYKITFISFSKKSKKPVPEIVFENVEELFDYETPEVELSLE